MGKYFGTDGFRGEVNVELTAWHAYEIGRFLGRYYTEKSASADAADGRRRGRVVIGKDPRRSSYMYEYALSAGLTASGADAYLLHVTTTPSVSYVTRTEDFDCGIMISASHNPYTDNGIKIFDSLGGKADEKLIRLIEAHLSAAEAGAAALPYALGEDVGRTVDFVAGRNRYIGCLISLSKVSFRGLKIGLDCANGASFFIAKSVFDALGAMTTAIHSAPDGLNINRNCGSTHPEDLQKCVLENKLDMAFAFDGDGDRCICVDEKGAVRDGDGILYACARYLASLDELDKDTVVATVMSNGGLFAALEEMGIHTEKTRVGDKYVYERMLETGASLGGEQSGHIIFSKHETTGDGIVTAIKLAEMTVESKGDFSALFEGLKTYPQTLVNVRVKDKDAVLNAPSVLAAAEAAEKLLRAHRGRLLLRPSGTEPLVRILAEAEEEKICSAAAESVRRAIEEARDIKS